MPQITFQLNGKQVSLEADPNTPLLWVLRDQLNLTGTKYGCGRALRGACTVQIDGKPIRSCVTPIEDVREKSVLTIEGLSKNGDHPLQRAWIEESVPQCGYCQAGQILQAAALLREAPNPTDEQIDRAMSGNLCRCGTYTRIRKAIHRAAGMQSDE